MHVYASPVAGSSAFLISDFPVHSVSFVFLFCFFVSSIHFKHRKSHVSSTMNQILTNALIRVFVVDWAHNTS